MPRAACPPRGIQATHQGPPLVRHAAFKGTVTETSSSRPPRGIRDDDVDGAARVRCVGTFPVAPRLSTTRWIDVRPSNLTTALPGYGVKTLSPWLPANPPRGGLTFVRLCSREHVTPAAWAQTPWDHRGGKGQVGYETFNGPHDRNWPQGYPRLKDSVRRYLYPVPRTRLYHEAILKLDGCTSKFKKRATLKLNGCTSKWESTSTLGALSKKKQPADPRGEEAGKESNR